MSSKGGTIKALQMLRRLPRITLGNITAGPEGKRSRTNRRGIHGKNPGKERRGNPMPAGYRGRQCPVFLKYPLQKYNKERFDISYVPLTLRSIQMMVDTNRLNTEVPIDITQLYNTGLIRVDPRMDEGGIMLEEEGVDCFCAPINLEVQFASEACIAAVERAGGTVTTAYYDPYSLHVALRPFDFFKKGEAIPRRQLPPQRLMEYYSDPRNRGYLADPDLIARDRLVLSQKYGYTLPDLASSERKELLRERKDPRQVFYGLQPGWYIDVAQKTILKPTDPELKEFYSS